MEFVALPVIEGDSFLLKDDGFNVLVDGGKETHAVSVIDLLKTEFGGKKFKIDVLICTHYDKDHINGINAILGSDIEISEVWLPALNSIYLKDGTVSDVRAALERYIQNIQKREKGKEDEEKSEFEDMDAIVKLSEDEMKYVRKYVDFCLIDHYSIGRYKNRECKYSKFIYNHNIGLPRNKYPFMRYNADTIINYSKYFCTLNVISKFYKTEINDLYAKILNFQEKNEDYLSILKKTNKIRYFEFINGLDEKGVFNEVNIVGLNCRETTYKAKTEKIEDIYMYLTPINKESLVFLYNKEGVAKILFTADSDLKCIKNEKLLKLIKETSLVTAPHHGSAGNKNVYNLINCKDKVVVRSDCANSKRPCKEYIDLSNKYCTICNNPIPTVHKKIRFELKGKEWHIEEKEKFKCTCKVR